MSGPEINSYATGGALPEALEACPEPCREGGRAHGSRPTGSCNDSLSVYS